MKKKCVFHYDNQFDRLFISCRKDNQKVHGSVRVHDLILDFTKDMRLTGVEIIKASEYLKLINVNPAILNNLTGAKIVFEQKRDGYLIYFILQAGKKVERIPYNLITEKPISV